MSREAAIDVAAKGVLWKGRLTVGRLRGENYETRRPPASSWLARTLSIGQTTARAGGPATSRRECEGGHGLVGSIRPTQRGQRRTSRSKARRISATHVQ